jgi:hypothetical protein
MDGTRGSLDRNAAVGVEAGRKKRIVTEGLRLLLRPYLLPLEHIYEE